MPKFLSYHKNTNKASITPVMHRGFTIVELLIVVVVIAILAAITIVAYNGITANAKEVALKSDLKTAATQLNADSLRNKTGFPTSQPDYIKNGLAYTGSSNTFCITGSVNNKDFYITESGSIQTGECPYMPPAGSMQAFTSSECSALATYTGSNPSAILSLTDSRGGTTRTYEVAKLADDNCWMLTNLKLGSESGPITLTPSDSSVASNFTLPQVKTTGSIASSGEGNGYDYPYAYGPITNDPGNYGYLYNFAAATAGETRTSFTTGNAPHSICPANWRLPSAGVYDTSGGLPFTLITPGDFSGLDIAFGGTGTYVNSGEANIAKWQPSGPFRGSFSGDWRINFSLQGDADRLWSASARPGLSGYAFTAMFDPSFVRPGDGSIIRTNGQGVRCLLN